MSVGIECVHACACVWMAVWICVMKNSTSKVYANRGRLGESSNSVINGMYLAGLSSYELSCVDRHGVKSHTTHGGLSQGQTDQYDCAVLLHFKGQFVCFFTKIYFCFLEKLFLSLFTLVLTTLITIAYQAKVLSGFE